MHQKAFLVLPLAIVAAGASAALTWNKVPMPTGFDGTSYRTWMLVDQATGNVYASKWETGSYTVFKLTDDKARAYGSTTGSDWSSIAGPSGITTGGDDNGTAHTIYNGKLYATAGFGSTSADRKLVRLDLDTQTWESGTKSGSNSNTEWGINYAGFVVNRNGKDTVYGQWCGTRRLLTNAITDPGFSYDNSVVNTNLTSYWGTDAVVGTNGYVYYYSQGLTNGKNQIRRASLTATSIGAELCTPWVDALGDNNTNQNARTGCAIEFVSKDWAESGKDELWVMAARIVEGTTAVQRSFIDRYDASTGSLLGSELLPFTMTNDGVGYDMAVYNGHVYVMAGRAGSIQGLYSAAVPEPTTIALLGLGALGLIRRRRQQ